MSDNGQYILEVDGLKTWFPVRRGVFSRIVGWVKAVDGVSFRVRRGKTLGLVGESGCGKTTVGRTILRLIPPTAGRVTFEGTDLLAIPPRRMRQMRRQIQIVFQDPVGSLNPRMTVGGIVGEALSVHGIARGREREERVARLLERVGLSAAHVNRYPHEFSGGQRQRIGIARALVLEPKFIVCDEPVSALDVSIQSQILNLLSDLQSQMGLSYLFIAHNLAVVQHVCDDVAVMYLGKIVEIGSAEEVYANPKHPYTQILLLAAPVPDPSKARGRRRVPLKGEVPSPVNPPSGCPFHPRCPLAVDLCRTVVPNLMAHAGAPADHLAACHRADEVKPGMVADQANDTSLLGPIGTSA